jgi:hypothetical protein
LCHTFAYVTSYGSRYVCPSASAKNELPEPELDAENLSADEYRPCEVLTYELSGILPQSNADTNPVQQRYFTLAELRRFRLSKVYPKPEEAAAMEPGE